MFLKHLIDAFVSQKLLNIFYLYIKQKKNSLKRILTLQRLDRKQKSNIKNTQMNIISRIERVDSYKIKNYNIRCKLKVKKVFFLIFVAFYLFTFLFYTFINCTLLNFLFL